MYVFYFFFPEFSFTKQQEAYLHCYSQTLTSVFGPASLPSFQCCVHIWRKSYTSEERGNLTSQSKCVGSSLLVYMCAYPLFLGKSAR